VLEVEFASPVDPKEFEMKGVSDIRRENSRLTMVVHESLDSIVQALSKHRIVNMTLKSYSLEQLFLKYYSREAGDRTR
jgi:hypothetical protein